MALGLASPSPLTWPAVGRWVAFRTGLLVCDTQREFAGAAPWVSEHLGVGALPLRGGQGPNLLGPPPPPQSSCRICTPSLRQGREPRSLAAGRTQAVFSSLSRDRGLLYGRPVAAVLCGPCLVPGVVGGSQGACPTGLEGRPARRKLAGLKELTRDPGCSFFSQGKGRNVASAEEGVGGGCSEPGFSVQAPRSHPAY